MYVDVGYQTAVDRCLHMFYNTMFLCAFNALMLTLQLNDGLSLLISVNFSTFCYQLYNNCCVSLVLTVSAVEP